MVEPSEGGATSLKIAGIVDAVVDQLEFDYFHAHGFVSVSGCELVTPY